MRLEKSRFAVAMLTTVVAVVLALAPSVCSASTYKVLHTFTGADGAEPYAGLIVDSTGVLYGTTIYGGNLSCTRLGLPNGCGTVFKLTRNSKGKWNESVLHSFSGSDGMYPAAGLILDAAGNLYGTTSLGGDLSCNSGNGCGTVFKLIPNSDGSWTESILHNFTSSPDGFSPNASLVLDASGNLYGTTSSGGGLAGYGTVFRLSPNSDGSWAESVLHSFNGADGSNPLADLIFDVAGSLYSTTSTGGAYGVGTVFKLAPAPGGSWTESVLFSFDSATGSNPVGRLIFDSSGNLYGTTMLGGAIHNCSGFCGLAFELIPDSDGSWGERVLQMFGNEPLTYPSAGLIFDTTGNLYGTAFGYSTGGGVFKMALSSSGKWTLSAIHGFSGQLGSGPTDSLVLDKAGNLYGTTNYCGSAARCNGVIFQITP